MASKRQKVKALKAGLELLNAAIVATNEPEGDAFVLRYSDPGTNPYDPKGLMPGATYASAEDVVNYPNAIEYESLVLMMHKLIRNDPERIKQMAQLHAQQWIMNHLHDLGV